MTTSTFVHPFQKAGFGTAPYRCVGVHENRFSMPDGTSKPGGCCDYCGTGILYEFSIRSSEGLTFVVGCDCAEKVGLKETIRETRLQHARAKRAAGTAIRKAQREAKWAEERAERVKATTEVWNAANGPLKARMDAYDGDNNFLKDMKVSLAYWGGLTEGQTKAVAGAFARMDRLAQSRLNSKHIGEVGKRMRGVKATVVSCRVAGQLPFYPFAQRIVITLDDEAGNQLVWWTSGTWIEEKDLGQPVVVDFTVKGHDTYNEVDQTTVTRLTFK